MIHRLAGHTGFTARPASHQLPCAWPGLHRSAWAAANAICMIAVSSLDTMHGAAPKTARGKPSDQLTGWHGTQLSQEAL